MEIPKSFKVGTKMYWVQQIPRRTSPTSLGAFYPALCTVVVSTHSRRKPRSVEAIGETFWHEATHCILNDMGHPLWKDERFVTQFSRRLNQLVHTAELEK